MRDEQELISQQMAATRSSLCEKIETLEQRVVETVTGARDAVTETVDTVKESVQGTVNAVKGTVHETVETVRGALDVKAHVARHPYVCMAAAAGVGFVLTRLLEAGPRPRSRTAHRLPVESAQGLTYAPAAPTPVDADVAGHLQRPAAPAAHEPRAAWLADLTRQFEPELRQIKSMAIGTGIGILRDLLLPSVPEQYRPTLTDMANRVTQKVGGEPYRVGTFNRLAESVGMGGGPRESAGRGEPNGRAADAYAFEGRPPL
jgi:ElaB/YqjD/DUF883 family membrane-anchored ribosome-binding protein